MPRNRKKPEPSDHRDLTERVVQLATLVSIVLGLPVAIAEGKPTSSVLALGIAFFCLGMWLLYLWRKRLASRDDKYKIQRLLTTALAATVVSGLAITMTVPPSRSYFIYNLLGFHRSSIALSQDGLSAAESSAYYRLIMPVYNSGPNDQVVKQMTLDVDWQHRVPCGTGPVIIDYQLADILYVGKQKGQARATVRLDSGAATGFQVPASGHLSDWGCGQPKWLSLSFPTPGLVIQGLTTTIIAVDIPTRFTRVAIAVDGQPIPKAQRQTFTVYGPFFPAGAYSGGNDYSSYTLTLTTTSGATLAACMPAGECW